ncbi:MAG TPA: triose-phosphate isomerase [Flavobacteriales bacterium]|jgi:triosephosphate isomerase (TIM)|nr:triose-phosphate isomerase [Flavobacteriales bacterium]HAW18583.1 triose-phosphate isomerase [Flavobacteriales bacterium]
MRKKLIAGNWKMNLDWNEAMTIFTDIIRLNGETNDHCDVVVIPPAPYLRYFFETTADLNSNIQVGAQDCSAQSSGAYTGEVAASMIHSVGAAYVLVGHSERREYHRESSDILSEKVERALEHGLIPIFCCGEKLDDRDNGNHTFVVDNQLDGTIFELSEDQFKQVVIAYEPVWAIGTGRTASPDQAQDMHSFIRGLVQSKYGESVASGTRILYGGSMKPANAVELLSQPDVDGGLIGGASLDPTQFLEIIKAAK